MLFSQPGLIRRVFGDRQIDEEHRILRRERERAMKIIERASEIAFGH